MTPKTWTEVLIERARCDGWLSGYATRGRGNLVGMRHLSNALSLLRPCEACNGTGDIRRGMSFRDAICGSCDGTGIAP
jgi:DnaJ-class molecular chaperone